MCSSQPSGATSASAFSTCSATTSGMTPVARTATTLCSNITPPLAPGRDRHMWCLGAGAAGRLREGRVDVAEPEGCRADRLHRDCAARDELQRQVDGGEAVPAYASQRQLALADRVGVEAARPAVTPAGGHHDRAALAYRPH